MISIRPRITRRKKILWWIDTKGFHRRKPRLVAPELKESLREAAQRDIDNRKGNA